MVAGVAKFAYNQNSYSGLVVFNRKYVSYMKNYTSLIVLAGLILLSITCRKDDIPSCDADLMVSEVTALPDSSNVLRYNIAFVTAEATDVHVNYWAVNTTKKQQSVYSDSTQNHLIRLINMVAETEYRYEVIGTIENCSYVSDTMSFSTGKLPEGLPEVDLLVSDIDFEGYLFFNSYQPGGVFAINSKGQIVWYELSYHAVKVSTLTPNSYAGLLGNSDFIEKDFWGNELRHSKYLSDFYNIAHHEIFINYNNQVVVLLDDYQYFDFSSIGGGTEDAVKSDAIAIFAADGTEVWRWRIFDVVHPADDPNILTTRTDWTHCNSVAYDVDGNLLLSVRNFNQIWKINRQDGSLIWKLGVNGDFEMDADDYFYHQHAAHITPNGDVMIFDNGKAETYHERSRVLSLNVNQATMNASARIKFELPEAYFSQFQSNCVLMGTDKVLIAASVPRKILITDFSGNTLWEAHIPNGSFYRVYHLREFY